MAAPSGPGAQPNLDSHRQREVRRYRDAHDLGFVVWMEIEPPGPPMPCPVADAQAGRRYDDTDLPPLPLAGCRRAWGCACRVVVASPTHASSVGVGGSRSDPEFDEALARLRAATARPARGLLAGAIDAIRHRAGRR